MEQFLKALVASLRKRSLEIDGTHDPYQDRERTPAEGVRDELRSFILHDLAESIEDALIEMDEDG